MSRYEKYQKSVNKNEIIPQTECQMSKTNCLKLDQATSFLPRQNMV